MDLISTCFPYFYLNLCGHESVSVRQTVPLFLFSHVSVCSSISGMRHTLAFLSASFFHKRSSTLLDLESG